MSIKLISKEIENREIPICFNCNENPLRENYKTCSNECSKKLYAQTARAKEFRRKSNKKYFAKPEVKKRISEYYKKYREELKKKKNEL